MSAGQHVWFKPEEKMKYIQDYFESGLTMRQYVQRKNLKLSTFTHWVRTYNMTMSLPEPGFQDVTPILKPQDNLSNPVMESHQVSYNIKMMLPNGISLEFDSSLLHNVLEELK